MAGCAKGRRGSGSGQRVVRPMLNVKVRVKTAWGSRAAGALIVALVSEARYKMAVGGAIDDQ